MQTIDVTGLPPDAVRTVQSLVTALRSRATAAETAPLSPAVERLLDTEYLAECEADTSPEVSLAEVRAGLAGIPGDTTADFAAERDER